EELTITDPTATSLIIADISICTGQTYVAYSPVVALDYSWTGPNGFSSEEESAALTEPGTYELAITDLNGCPVEASFEVVIDDELLSADFLVAAEAYVGDTLVIIDISWPIPDDLTWTLPKEARILTSDEEYSEVVFDEAGVFSIGMSCMLAGCNASYEQTITISEYQEEEESSLRFDAPKESAIKSLSAYPNPTSGEFSVVLKLNKERSASIKLVDLSGNTVPYSDDFTGADEYELRIDGTGLTPGMYFIQAEAGNEQKVFRLMIR
ncbi:MAG: T9SS type A sorting domain-containing protein, partial [Cytophagales bacterium]|nr:T9SS type A sorting domain-containing protein [Cytophagales bacterium]